MKKATLIIFLALTFFSCQKSKPDTLSEVKEQMVIPVVEALSSLNAAQRELYPNTKAIDFYDSIEDIVTIGKESFERTKSSSELFAIPDTLFYLVNFRKEKGFAILSANKQLSDDIYAITDNGSLSILDFQKAYEFFNTDNHNNSDSTITDIGELTVPSIILSGIFSDLVNDTDSLSPEPKTKVSFTTKYGPFVKTKWDQRKPFNDLTKPGCPAGCVAIATAQILVANKKSNTMSVNGKLCNWADLESVYNYQNPTYAGSLEAQIQAANFMKIIGDGKHCKIRYGEKGSSGYAEGAQRTFQALGYKDVDKHLGFGSKNQRIAKRIISHGKAVYLDGCKKGSSEGHAWVLDGYAKSSDGKEYYHINWGWKGTHDGYFSCGTFNTANRKYVDDEIDKNTSLTTSDDSNYTWTYRMVTYSL